jgi:hypothetical protein
VIAPRTRRLLLCAAASAHLLVALVYSTHVLVEYHLPPAIERVMRSYGLYTGTSAHFNFFAPTVATQYRAQFLLTTRDGRTRPADIRTDSSEANQRLALMVNAYQIPEARPYLVRSWVVFLLERNPDAASVETRVSIFEIPRIAEARSGKRATWVELERTFMRREDVLGH